MLLRQDDEFFVDQVRTTDAEIRAASTKGTFWTAHTLDTNALVACVLINVTDEAPAGTSERVSLGAANSTATPYVCKEVRGRCASIGMLTVASAWKGHGLGAQMLYLADLESVYLGCEAQQIFVVSVKPWLRAWYEKRGYVCCTGITLFSFLSIF